MTTVVERLKTVVGQLRDALATADIAGGRHALAATLAPSAAIRMCHPFGDLAGPEAWTDNCFAPLLEAMPDLERRDAILVAGTTPEGQHWIGCMGNYMGTFVAPFLGIAPTGHLAHMRYHEFFRFEGERAVEVQAIWDIPELMMQAHAWPMAPQLGAFLCTPGPMTQDGLTVSGDGAAALAHVKAMLDDMCRHPGDPDPAVMQLEKYWHPRFNWYGPAGIGTGRGTAGFRNWHQIPFLNAMPDRGQDRTGLMTHWIAQGNYVAETGWPNMRQTLSADGWLGIAPSGQTVTMRSLDFWRLENGLIRENWVLVDLLDMYAQIGVDVLARMREFNKARVPGRIAFPVGEP